MPKTKKSSKTCCICLDTITIRKEARITSCRHRYCKKCIRKWSRIDNRCPQCKRRFNWIIGVKDKRKEKVWTRNKDRSNLVSFMVTLVRNFLYNSEFRYMMTTSIMRANNMAISLFDFLYSIVTDFNIKSVVRDTQDVQRAFVWLYAMREINNREVTCV